MRAEGFDARLALAHDVHVLVHALAGLRVVVVQVEGVRLRLLQEVDDVAVLLRALDEPVSAARPARRPAGESEDAASAAARLLTAEASAP